MPNQALGTKRRCGACGAPFYDLAREPIRCPKCDTPFVIELPARRSVRPPKSVRRAPPPAVRIAAEEPEAGAVPTVEEDEEAEIEAEVEATELETQR